MRDLRPGPSVLLYVSLASQGVLLLTLLFLSSGPDRPRSSGLTVFTAGYLLLMCHGIGLAWVERKGWLMALQIAAPAAILLGMLWKG